jgi:eukaryotic-like serine/threonine-protein kinase
VPERFLGRTLGKFRVDAIVGTGGFAWVYKAFDPELEIPVALKVLKPQYAGDEQFEQRFRREAATAARLRHPNIIKIFAVGRDGDAVYFAMDFLAQGLPDRLEVVTKLPEPVLVRMGIDVASALGFAHREGVVHRDIKVDNILFDEHGNAIVADFGIARAVSNYVKQTGTNMVVGTPQYFSPEQARGQSLDGRADIYSLGVTLYRAATGVLPFTGEDWYEIARQHVEERPMRLRAHNPMLSRDLERVVLRCLEKDPAARYQTGETLCQALAALSFERSETVAMRSTPSFQSSEAPTAPIGLGRSRWRAWRRPLVAVATAAVAVAAVIAGGRLTIRAGGTGKVPGLTPPTGVAAAPSGPASGVDPLTGTATIPSAPDTSHPTPESAGTGGAITEAAGATSASGHVSGARSAETPRARRARAAKIAASDSAHSGADDAAATGTTRSRDSGTLRLDVQPATASYSLLDLTDGRIIRGTIPKTDSLAVPAGQYALQISARYCATFRDTVRVSPNRPTAPLRVRLVCGS